MTRPFASEFCASECLPPPCLQRSSNCCDHGTRTKCNINCTVPTSHSIRCGLQSNGGMADELNSFGIITSARAGEEKQQSQSSGVRPLFHPGISDDQRAHFPRCSLLCSLMVATLAIPWWLSAER